MGYVSSHRQQPSDPQHMGTAFNPAKTSPASWDAFSDVEAFVDAVLAGPWRQRHATTAVRAEATVDRSGAAQGDHGHLVRRVLRHAVAGDWPALRHSIRHAVHAVRPRLGLWRRLLNRLIQTWRQACGDKPVPSAVIVDSRSCHSAPTCFGRGFDGGKKIKGIKVHLVVDKYGL